MLCKTQEILLRKIQISLKIVPQNTAKNCCIYVAQITNVAQNTISLYLSYTHTYIKMDFSIRMFLTQNFDRRGVKERGTTKGVN